MQMLLLSRSYTEPRHSLLFMVPGWGGGPGGLGGDTARTGDPN